MGAWVGLAAGIAVLDVALDRAGYPMLSHTYWALVGDRSTRWLPVGVWSAVTFHLHAPRRPWRQAIGVGLSAAVATRIMR